MAAKQKFSFIQSELFWIAVISIAFKMWFSTKDAAETFGTWVDIMKKINGSVMWATALLSGRRFVVFLISIKKMPETISDINEGTKE